VATLALHVIILSAFSSWSITIWWNSAWIFVEYEKHRRKHGEIAVKKSGKNPAKTVGRPKKQADHVRSMMIPVRISREELDRLRQLAGDQGLARYVRRKTGLDQTGYGTAHE
jgi:hypothetical protein